MSVKKRLEGDSRFLVFLSDGCVVCGHRDVALTLGHAVAELERLRIRRDVRGPVPAHIRVRRTEPSVRHAEGCIEGDGLLV